MSTYELQQLKLAWLAAQEAGDALSQQRLLLDHPQQRQELIDFIIAYYASGSETSDEQDEQNSAVIMMTQRATQAALTRVFFAQTVTELRKKRNLGKLETAQALRLAANVWQKLEDGKIRAASLSSGQLERLAQFFQVSTQQFIAALHNSNPVLATFRRQTIQGARAPEPQPNSEDFADAVQRSNMPDADKQFWLK